MVLIDAYPKGGYSFQNVGVDDYSGGYQIRNICIPVDTTGHFLLRKQSRTVIMPDGLDLNMLWKKMAASAAAPAMWWFPRNPGAD